MISILKLPYENHHGNLNWLPPYLYPTKDLEYGMAELREKGYFISPFPEGDGITFSQGSNPETGIYNDFCLAFPWMDIVCYERGKTFDYKNDLLKYQIVVLPLSRLRIKTSILNKDICLFPPGEFSVELLNIVNLSKQLSNNISGSLRDLITSTTEVDNSVFTDNPIIVFRDEISYDQYMKLSHHDDSLLIKKYAERADRLLDIIRFYECDYTIPDRLPGRPGLWNDRYSTALIYFPVWKISMVQARDVEIRICIKGIGLEVSQVSNPGINLLLPMPISEMVNFAWHALRINTQILEADTESLKFIQVMMLFEYLANPIEYISFKKRKGHLIAVLTEDRKKYHELSENFKTYSENIRTNLIHNGKRIEELLPEDEIKQLFQRLQSHIRYLIEDIFEHLHMSWVDYDNTRKQRMESIIGIASSS